MISRDKLGLLLLAILFLIAICLAGCASNDWSRRDTIGELAVVGTLAIDAYQTAQFQHHEDQQEIGWVRGICGAKPSSACSYEYFGTVAISHWLIAKLLPATWRRYWQAGAVAVEIPVIYSNTRLRP